MYRFALCSLLLLLALIKLPGQENPNLFPNGDVENVMTTLFVMDDDYASHIETGETGLPSFWRLSDGVALSKDGYSGSNAILMWVGKMK